jgi:hypothetical protein
VAKLMKRESNFIWAVKKDIQDFETQLNAHYAKFSKLLEKDTKSVKSDDWQTKLADSQVKAVLANLRAIVEVHNMILESITNTWRYIGWW